MSMSKRESKPMSDLMRGMLRRNPVYTFPSVAHDRLRVYNAKMVAQNSELRQQLALANKWASFWHSQT